MSGKIVDLSREKPPAGIKVEICVIGSGCGGATAARLLAEAGKEVVVLEEGTDMMGRKNQRDGEMYDQLYMDRGGRATEDLSISVLQGRVLGGGGVINASDVVPIAPGVLDFWQKKFGLKDFHQKHLAPYQKRALADLHVNRIPESMVNKANQLLREGAQKRKLRGEVMQHNRVGCIGLGTCLIGCPVNAKRNPRMISIPKAVEAGAQFYCRARAVKIEEADQTFKRVVVHTLDPKGYHERARFTLEAKVVILAANAVASAQLLLRSGIGNAHVGRHLSLQPQLPIMAIFKDRINAFRGIPQSYAVTEFEEEHNEKYGLWGFRIEGIMGTPGIVSTMSPYMGLAGKQAMVRYGHIAASLLLVPDQPSGHIALTGTGRPLVRYRHLDNHKVRLRKALKVAAQIYLDAGALYVEVPMAPPLLIRNARDLRKIDEVPFRPASAPFISAHQQGGVRMAPDPKDGAANPEGLVYGTKDVYVFDSSGYPSSSSSHTMTPIITTSYYLADRLRARL